MTWTSPWGTVLSVVRFIPCRLWMHPEKMETKLKRNTTMMKTLLSVGSALWLAASVLAQGVVTEVIVAAGGKFSDPTDHASIGIYSPATGQYVLFDSLKTASVQDVKVANGRIYLASHDSLVVYDGASLMRDTMWHYPNIGRLYVDADVLAATKLFGDSSVPVLQLYNPTDYGRLLAVDSPDVPGITGITRVGDSLFFSYNIKGTVDLFPPYGVYADSIGALLRVNLTTPALEANIVLDTNAAGLSELVTVYDTMVAGIASETNNVVVYWPRSGGYTSFFDSLRSREVVLSAPAAVYVVGEDTAGMRFLYRKDLASDSATILFVMGPSAWGNSIAAVAVDTLNAKVYYSRTDYATWGKVYVADFGAAAPSDSFAVGISPEAMTVRYRLTTGGVAFRPSQPLLLTPMPNPATRWIRLSWSGDEAPTWLEVYSASGARMALVRRPNRQAWLDVRQWPAGTYYVRAVFEGRGTAVAAFRKQ